MSDIAIRVDNISKKYFIGNTSSGSLRETLVNTFSTGNKTKTEEFWALKDVSFEVKRGEAIGIIGKNGAGKSTLLKILSRITEPTKGRIEIDGRVSSLLEVGTGFHPELTGRENVFLNGTVLGMKRQEIKDKFDEIVAFSGVEKFLDTPVKRYSSGMKVRLAFAVAAHLEPEILIIDEVLAVGDAEFQKKCLGKMQDVAGEGRTVLFVSHNLGAVCELCSRGVLLANGQVKYISSANNVVRKYLESHDTAQGTLKLDNYKDRKGEGAYKVTHIKTTDENNHLKTTFTYRESICIHFGVEGEPKEPVNIGVSIRNQKENLVLHYASSDDIKELKMDGKYTEFKAILRDIYLNEGEYYITIRVADKFRVMQDRVENCLSFKVINQEEGIIKCQTDIRLIAEWYVNDEVFDI